MCIANSGLKSGGIFRLGHFPSQVGNFVTVLLESINLLLQVIITEHQDLLIRVILLIL